MAAMPNRRSSRLAKFPLAIPFLLAACSAAQTDPASSIESPASSSESLWLADVLVGGSPGSDPGVASWGPGRFDMFYMSNTGSGTLRHRWFQNSWSYEEDLGGSITSPPAAVSWGRGRIDIFAKGTDSAGNPNKLMHLWFDHGWHPWESLGGSLSSGVSVASWAPGRLDVFYNNSVGALGHIYFDGGWSGHEQLGTETFFGAPSAVSWSSGRIDVFARSPAAGEPLIHKWFAGGWSGWETLGGSMCSNPAAASWGPGRLDIFYFGCDRSLRQQWWDGSWHSEASLGGTYYGNPTAISWGGQRIDVFGASWSSGLLQRTWIPGATREVLTQHNDASRSGAALAETTLTPANVNPAHFGLSVHRAVTGNVYAQPLYVENVSIPGVGLKNVLYVATLENRIYAIDADSTLVAPTDGRLWTRTGGVDFDAPMPNALGPDGGNWNFGAGADPHLGVVSTPVIDRASNTMYVVDGTLDASGARQFRLHALDITTGADRRPSVVVGGSYTDPTSHVTKTFNPQWQNNRPGLLLANGNVYVAFGSSMDRSAYNGWVFAHRTSDLARVASYCTTGDWQNGGGIWQSGNWLAADERGNVYFITGNGLGSPAGATPNRQENSFVKLDPSLHVLGSYWPHQDAGEFKSIEDADIDLGSGGAMLVPGQDAVVGGGKSGKLYNLDRTLGENQAPFQAFLNTWISDPPSAYLHDMDKGPNIHGAPVYWQTSDPARSYVYAWSEKDSLKAYPFNRNTLTVDTVHPLASALRSRTRSMPGGMLSVSANGTTPHTGVVWAVVEEPTAPSCGVPTGESPSICGATYADCNALCFEVPGHLVAFDAETLAKLYETTIYRYSKFTPPTIANGKVVVSTFNGEILIFATH